MGNFKEYFCINKNKIKLYRTMTSVLTQHEAETGQHAKIDDKKTFNNGKTL